MGKADYASAVVKLKATYEKALNKTKATYETALKAFQSEEEQVFKALKKEEKLENHPELAGHVALAQQATRKKEEPSKLSREARSDWTNNQKVGM